MEVADGVLQFRVKIPAVLDQVNSYLIEGTDGWLMVDGGWDTAEGFDELAGLLTAAGIAITDIATIVCTHLHRDHCGHAGRFQQLSPRTKVLVHRWDWSIHDSRYGAPRRGANEVGARWLAHGVPTSYLAAMQDAAEAVFHPLPADLEIQALYGGEVISTGTHDLEVIWSPGHSPGHVSLYERKQGWLFTGDHVLGSTVPLIGFHGQCGDDPLGDYIASLRKLQRLFITQVFPGHEACFGDLTTKVDRSIVSLQQRQDEVLRMLDGNQTSAYDIALRLGWDANGQEWDEFSPLHQGANVAATIAFLQHLRWQGAVRQLHNNGAIVFETYGGRVGSRSNGMTPALPG